MMKSKFPHDAKIWFITGVAGVKGSRLLEWILDTTDHYVICIDDMSAQRDFIHFDFLKKKAGYLKRIIFRGGDITHPSFVEFMRKISPPGLEGILHHEQINIHWMIHFFRSERFYVYGKKPTWARSPEEEIKSIEEIKDLGWYATGKKASSEIYFRNAYS